MAYFKVVIVFVLIPLALCEYPENTEITANIAEGERVIAEYEALLADENVGDMAKLTSVIKVATLISAAQSVDLHSAGNLQLGASSVLSSDWKCELKCCKVRAEALETGTHIVRQCTRYKSFSWYDWCGPGTFGKCTFYGSIAETYECYKTSVIYKLVPKPCPDGRSTCCVGHVWYKMCCISIAELKRIINEAYGN